MSSEEPTWVYPCKYSPGGVIDTSRDNASPPSRFSSSNSVFNYEANGFGQSHWPSSGPKEYEAPESRRPWGIWRGKGTSLMDLELLPVFIFSPSWPAGQQAHVFGVTLEGCPQGQDCACKAKEALPTSRNRAAVAPRAPTMSMPMAVVMLAGEKKTLPWCVLFSSLKRPNPNRVVAAPSQSMMIGAGPRTTVRPERDLHLLELAVGPGDPSCLSSSACIAAGNRDFHPLGTRSPLPAPHPCTRPSLDRRHESVGHHPIPAGSCFPRGARFMPSVVSLSPVLCQNLPHCLLAPLPWGRAPRAGPVLARPMPGLSSCWTRDRGREAWESPWASGPSRAQP